MLRFISLAAALIVLAIASPAWAQLYADFDGNEDAQVLYVSSTTTTSTAVGVALIAATVVTVTPDEESAYMERYLRDNPVAIRAAISLGAGDSVNDLAAIMNIPAQSLSEFGAALRTQRAQLLELADPGNLTTSRAAEFVARARDAWATHAETESTSS